MWIYTSGTDGLPKIILYEYQPGRGGIHPQEFLEGFHGLLQCDGYQGYNKVDDVLLACCMAHCRRKFYEALPAEKKKSMKLLDINSPIAIKEPDIPQNDLEKYITTEIGVAYCNKLFYLEREFKDLSPEERKAKSYAIGRKASLFHASVAGANASAIIYSLVETAKANNLNVFQYIYTLLLYMPGHKNGPDVNNYCHGVIS